MSTNIFRYIRDVDEFIQSVYELKGIQLNKDLSSVIYSQKHKTFTTRKTSEGNKNGVTMRNCDLSGLYGEGEKPNKNLTYYKREKETEQYRGIDLELFVSEGVFKIRDLKEVFETLS